MSDRNAWLEIKSAEVLRDQKIVFKNLNLKLYLGQNIIIIGPNGAGKSTLLSLIDRTLYPKVKQGSYLKIFGTDLIDIWLLRERIGYVSKEIDKRIERNILTENVILSGLHGKLGTCKLEKIDKYSKFKLNQIIQEIGLEKLTKTPYGKLSEGQRRKVLIARALAHEPDVLVLDEPTAHLDISSQHELIILLEQLCRQGKTLVTVTHNLDLINKETHRVLLLKSGEIVGDGSPIEELTSSKLSKLYNSPLKVICSNGYWRIIPEIS